jgi:MaoC like domain
MGDAMETYRVRARNTAPDSENRIHNDRTAAAHGFNTGLVPGVTVYGYLTVPVVRQFGMDWVARGGMRVRFQQPVYDGEEVLVELTGNQVNASRTDGTVCATGEILWPETPPPSLALYPQEPLPAARPPASAESLAPGRVLGTLYAGLSLPDHAFLALQDEILPLYQEGILHPAALLTFSNHILMQNVELGPWIHAASEVLHFSLARQGERLSVRGRVAERFERKGHRFVVLDILVAVGERPVQHVRHTAIYQLRTA